MLETRSDRTACGLLDQPRRLRAWQRGQGEPVEDHRVVPDVVRVLQEGAVGVALLTTVIAAVGPTRIVARHVVANLGAYHASFLAAGTVEALAIVVALRIKDIDAAGTMVRRGRLAQGEPRVAVPVPAEVV